MRRSLCFFLILTLFYAATPQSGYANVIGTDFQIFNPSSSGDRYFTVHSSNPLKPGQLNLGLFIDGAMNTLPESAPDGENDRWRRKGYQDFLISSVLHVGFGLLKNWDIGFSVPFVAQTIKEEEGKVSFEAEGLTEYRLTTRIKLLGDETGGLAITGLASLNQVDNNPYMGDEDSFSVWDALNFQVELVGHTQLGSSVDAAVNVGYRSRNPGNTLYPNFPVDPIKDQITSSVALGWDFSQHWRWITEVYGAYTLEDFRSDLYRTIDPVELVTGLRYQSGPYMHLYAGAGTEVFHATATPDVRIFAGVNWSPELYKEAKPLPAPAPIPAPEPEPIVEDIPTEKIVVENIYFETGSYRKILPGSMAAIKKVADYLKSIDFQRLVIEGHTDSVGSDTMNMTLSQNRAQSIKEILVNRFGLGADKISTDGFGETRPVDTNDTAAGRQKNRRVEFNIFESAAPQPDTSSNDVQTDTNSSDVQEDVFAP